ncbi:GNAT family N-acetyltransferase [Octadecabacter sp. G9-8]|uniref:GNAT family N-acetyltransferase n=1 Tax=Octadecabacter dasysiphoniae TaxID=2909341 RepID=A0ABS9D0A7_9RHOB|nr:GNAT family N-acetyltransferase [Octadecabacter dasysiphoniae]MCF2871743.1 GNAT family N-acetyltransferase [Octadecabacter dasysiphoniae]
MTPESLTALIDATWPARAIDVTDGWTIRTGAGGGSRVSCASRITQDAKIEDAEAAMRTVNQTPLFMVRHGEDMLDRDLQDRGYHIKDPVTFYTCPTSSLATQRPPAATCFEVWPPLATQVEIWAAGGIDAARLAIMDRAVGPKTTVLGRLHDTPAGTAFAAIHDGTAMLHAIETAAAFRRQGIGRHMIRALAFWAQVRGADTVTLLVTKANVGANALYTSMGFSAVGGYQYRIHPEAT